MMFSFLMHFISLLGFVLSLFLVVPAASEDSVIVSSTGQSNYDRKQRGSCVGRRLGWMDRSTTAF